MVDGSDQCMLRCSLVGPPPTRAIVTNASTIGWGAQLGTSKVPYLWIEHKLPFTSMSWSSELFKMHAGLVGLILTEQYQSNVFCEQAGRRVLQEAIKVFVFF